MENNNAGEKPNYAVRITLPLTACDIVNLTEIAACVQLIIIIAEIDGRSRHDLSNF